MKRKGRGREKVVKRMRVVKKVRDVEKARNGRKKKRKDERRCRIIRESKKGLKGVRTAMKVWK
jgi:hypothetical protein